jgi:hypothetical protein
MDVKVTAGGSAGGRSRQAMTGGGSWLSTTSRSSSPVLFLEFFLVEFFPDFSAEWCVLRQGWSPCSLCSSVSSQAPGAVESGRMSAAGGRDDGSTKSTPPS